MAETTETETVSFEALAPAHLEVRPRGLRGDAALRPQRSGGPGRGPRCRRRPAPVRRPPRRLLPRRYAEGERPRRLARPEALEPGGGITMIRSEAPTAVSKFQTFARDAQALG